MSINHWDKQSSTARPLEGYQKPNEKVEHPGVGESYSELDKVSTEMDILGQLKANIDHLEGLHHRMQYMMAEVKSLIVRL